MNKQPWRPIDMTLAAMFAALMAIGANVSAYLTIGGVPITFQLLFAILAGVLLGSRLGAASMTLYMLIGLVGMPVFAQFKGGIGHVISPTFGFVVSFIAVAYAVGKVVERKSDPTIRTYLFAGACGLFLNYLIGAHYMYAAYTLWFEAPGGFNYLLTWSWMAAYLPIDTGVVVAAALIAPKVKKVVLEARPAV